MQSAPLKIAALALFGAMVVSGCRCGETTTTRRVGEIGVVHKVGEETQTSRDAVYDFGSVFMGQTQTTQLIIRNVGAGALTLSGLEKTEGVEVEINGQATGDGPALLHPVRGWHRARRLRGPRAGHGLHRAGVGPGPG